jgi:membrane protein involved in colicin uptake
LFFLLFFFCFRVEKDEEARAKAEQAKKDEEARAKAEQAKKDEETRAMADSDSDYLPDSDDGATQSKYDY